MRRWKKALLAAALCAAALLALMVPAFGSAASVNLMAVNDTVLDITPENMPRTVGGVLYVPYTMLSKQVNGINLGVNAMYSTTKRTVLVTDGQRGVVFNTQSNTAQDVEGNPVPVRAMVRNSTVFLPIDWLCEYFGVIGCTRTRTPYGTLIRITNRAVVLSDRDFADAAAPQLADNLRRYLEAGGRGEGEDPVPSGGAEPSPPPDGAELTLACRWGEEAEECAKLIEDRDQRALFLFAPEEIAGQDGLIRRLAGAGHTLGLVLSGGDPAGCLAQAREGRALLAAAARYPALVAAAPELDEAGREALREAGYVVWTPTARGESFSSGGALVRGLSARQVNYVEIACAAGGAAFLRGALNLMEEENCQVFLATAPSLS